MSDNGRNTPDGEHLKAFFERIERIEETIREEQDARKEIYAEAKGAGFDPKIMRKIVALRRVDKAKRDEAAELLDLYMAAIGMDG